VQFSAICYTFCLNSVATATATSAAALVVATLAGVAACSRDLLESSLLCLHSIANVTDHHSRLMDTLQRFTDAIS